ncbi:hypothetical protein [Candidatus Methylobacter oryzae]|uniref:Uncharacterized protein n=1 Tax=Candidatus Methylobacter oryzae TaxID=2497749 RepID=A0ABY3CED1_9GAMM|nr:hypothetical protein [Candidatus Methylobacter oryzae]TRX01439.1 hypothetical protein EKO24_003930 [Candidatus Methylobacter oryzae]
MLNRLNLTAEKPNICEPVKTSAKRILAHFLPIEKHILINTLPKTRNIGFLWALQVRISAIDRLNSIGTALISSVLSIQHDKTASANVKKIHAFQ